MKRDRQKNIGRANELQWREINLNQLNDWENNNPNQKEPPPKEPIVLFSLSTLENEIVVLGLGRESEYEDLAVYWLTKASEPENRSIKSHRIRNAWERGYNLAIIHHLTSDDYAELKKAYKQLQRTRRDDNLHPVDQLLDGHIYRKKLETHSAGSPQAIWEYVKGEISVPLIQLQEMLEMSRNTVLKRIEEANDLNLKSGHFLNLRSGGGRSKYSIVTYEKYVPQAQFLAERERSQK